MTKGTKTFFMVFGAVVAGIVIYAYLTKKTIPQILAGIPVVGNQLIGPGGPALFYGPEMDPATGAYLPPGAQPGTVAFSTQPPGVS